MTPDSSAPGTARPVLHSVAAAIDLVVRASAGHPLLLVGITGSPGAGKSTLAEELQRGVPGAVVLGLDGYHMPQSRLRELGRRERMGAPDTFDTAGFVEALRRLRRARPGDMLSFASFDRSIEEPVPGGIVLAIGDPSVVLIEGNYLLLEQEGWDEVAPLLDLTLHLRIDPAVRRRRLVARHLRFGKPLDEALAWSAGPDERNAELIEAAAARADAILGPAPERPLRLLHLSDTHLLGRPDARYNRVIDTRASLAAVLDSHAAIEDIDAVIVSGDLSGDGSAASYAALREMLTAWCTERGAALVLALGNHDERESFGSPAPWNTETLVRGVRILTLDSSVPGGASWGLLTEPTLSWLREHLRREPLAPTVLVLHHPPIEAVTPLHRTMGLANPHDLWEAVAGASVRAVLSGHWHHAFVDTTTPAPVVVAPGAANRTDVLAGPAHERSVAASGASIVEVLPGGVRVTSTEIDAPHRGTELFDVSGDVLADWQRRLGFPGGR
ncbi:Calcineurin-like phosphoesterase [Rathayibacter oskolensis]|uniref:Calcineurin-like phosphoesterase n=1 Tax=Rathayibacter oskolensis TaxID=1891671 RepID=A0A1X7PHH7_9MICO|nr:metallophosphoesterase [Rathayibacter oskolensis]SMH50029.1 Calcineurin-like phosphoesterase [Rathayibacter oskolensis]